MALAEDALRLAGFALAHAAWSVEDGETLCTLAFIEFDGTRELVRYEAASIPESVDIARADIGARASSGEAAVLVFDGYATPESGSRTDALMAEITGSAGRLVGRVVLPYRAAHRSRIPFRRGGGFALLGRPWADLESSVPNAEALILDGFRDHPHGKRLLESAVES